MLEFDIDEDTECLISPLDIWVGDVILGRYHPIYTGGFNRLASLHVVTKLRPTRVSISFYTDIISFYTDIEDPNTGEIIAKSYLWQLYHIKGTQLLIERV